MNITNSYTDGLNGVSLGSGTKGKESSPGEAVKAFSQFLNEAIDNVNQQQQTASQLVKKVVSGDIQDVQQAMIAGQKASLGLELTIQVRNKAVEAYQEIMRMNV